MNVVDRLIQGNRAYLESADAHLREALAAHGQQPYAVVVTCSDSRVIPEALFSAGPGELFVVRVAGNVLDAQSLGSIQYAVEHLGCRCVVMLGHTGCGAVAAALQGHAKGHVASIVQAILRAVDRETRADEAARLNVQYGVRRIREAFPDAALEVRGAMFDTARGTVAWL